PVRRRLEGRLFQGPPARLALKGTAPAGMSADATRGPRPAGISSRRCHKGPRLGVHKLASMPELPEVETIRRQLAPLVEGRRLVGMDILDPRWSRPLAPRRLRAALVGRRVERLDRRGKYLVWSLEGDVHLAQHLRMTGAVLYEAEGSPIASPHTRVRLQFSPSRASPSRRGAPRRPPGPRPPPAGGAPRPVWSRQRGPRSPRPAATLSSPLPP